MKNYFVPVCIALLACACNPQEAVPPQNPDNAAATAPAAATPKQADAYKVINWGQQSTQAGTPFNVQADGNSGISFELNQPPAAEVKVMFDGKPLTGVAVGGVVVTATIPADYIAKSGSYPVVLQIPSLGQEFPAGSFEVK